MMVAVACTGTAPAATDTGQAPQDTSDPAVAILDRVDLSGGYDSYCTVRRDTTVECFVRAAVYPLACGRWSDALAAGLPPGRSVFLSASMSIVSPDGSTLYYYPNDWQDEDGHPIEIPEVIDGTDWVAAGASCMMEASGALTCPGPLTCPWQQPPPEQVAELAMSGGACAIELDGSVSCWNGRRCTIQDDPCGCRDRYRPALAVTHGLVDNGTLICGLDSEDHIWCDMTGSTLRPEIPIGTYAEVGLGMPMSLCALDLDGAATCTAGPGSGEAPLLPPTAAGLHDLGMAMNVACALDADDEVVCWDENGPVDDWVSCADM
jgi:hypothetical protein